MRQPRRPVRSFPLPSRKASDAVETTPDILAVSAITEDPVLACIATSRSIAGIREPEPRPSGRRNVLFWSLTGPLKFGYGR
jgi:hypothetical protein